MTGVGQAKGLSASRGYMMRAAAVLLAIIGVAVVQVVPLAVTIARGGPEQLAYSLTFLGLLLCVPLFALAVTLIRRSRRHLAVSAEEAMRDDPRPPVLYLRSFKSDKRAARLDFGGFGPWFWLWPAGIYAMAREWRGSSEEEYWSAALAEIGPPIALGAPGQLPFRGAARLYASQEDWRDVVLNFARKASLVVVLAGMTDALMWEIHHVAGCVARRKLIFLLSNDRKDYEGFRAALHREMGIDAGERPPVAHRMNTCAVLRLTDDGQPEVLPVWGASRTNVATALAPVVQAAGPELPPSSTREGVALNPA